jgi:hypothetical protein
LHHGLNEAALRKDREMTNPLRKHTSSLFASRGCDIDAAVTYAKEVLEAMSGEERPLAYTAMMVVLNTAANAFDQAQGPSPERLALIDLIDERIRASASNIDQQISDWMDDNVDHDDLISQWMSDNFDLHDHNISDIITDWMNNNLDDKIADIDLVVRVR